MKDRARLAALAALGAMVIATAALLARVQFPPGADPGLWLATARGDLAGPPTAPPLVPLLLRAVFAAPVGAAFAMTKALALALYALVALAAGALAEAVGGRAARAWGIGLALANPLLLQQVVIGAYPQLAGLALALAGFAWLARYEASGARRDLALASGALALVAASHAYTTALVALAAACYLAFSGLARRVLVALAFALALALALAPWYVRYLGALKSYAPTSAGTAGAVAVALGSTLAQWPGLLALFAAISIGGALALRSRAGGARVTVSLLVACVALFAATPFALTGRVLLFACVALVPLAAAGLARAPRSVAIGAAVALALFAPLTLAGVAEELPRHAPLGEPTLAAARALEGERGAIVVASPWANVDAWWLAGLTGRAVLPADAEVWLATDDAVRRAMDAKTVIAGTHALDGGAARVIDGGNASRASSPAVWAANAIDFAPLVRVPDEGLEIEAAPGWLAAASSAPAVAAGGEGIAFALDGGWWRIERRATGSDDRATLAWRFRAEGAALAEVRVPVLPGEGARFVEWDVGASGARVVVEQEWSGARSEVALAWVADAPVEAALRDGGLVLTLSPGSGEARLTLTVRVPVEGASEWRATNATAILDAWSATRVYARGANAALDARFDRDPLFARAFEQGDVRAWKRTDK